MNYISPKAIAKSFTCPYCGTISQQEWWAVNWSGVKFAAPADNRAPIKIGTCTHCMKHTLWVGPNMMYPVSGNAPFPNPEMPESVKALYYEAAAIQTKSPRGAAALLRLSIQVLCKELGEKGKNINDDIGSLVKKGLPEVVQQSLDVVRVTGNNAVHPGQISVDDPEVVETLFGLINVIIEYMIALPKKVSGLYATLPKAAVESINKRDGT